MLHIVHAASLHASSDPFFFSSHLDQFRLSRDDRPVLNRRGMAPSNVSIDGQVPVQVGQDLLGTRDVPPVTHKITDNCEHADELHAGLLHAGVGCVADELRVGTGSLDVGEDRVALCAQREREERGAHIGGDTGDDDLLLSGGFDGGAEVRVVPSTGDELAHLSSFKVRVWKGHGGPTRPRPGA